MTAHGHALIFANGAPDPGPFVNRALFRDPNPLIVAADGGARMAYQAYGLLPHVIVGDMDSLTREEVTRFESKGVEVVRYPPEKDETDLEIALKWTLSYGIKRMDVVGALGQRIDQTLGNMYLLALPELAPCDIRLVAGKQELRLLHPGDTRLDGDPGDTISLVPIGGPAVDVHTQDLYYPLYKETLTVGPARAISNVMNTHTAHVSLRDGLLLVVHTQGRA